MLVKVISIQKVDSLYLLKSFPLAFVNNNKKYNIPAKPNINSVDLRLNLSFS